MLSEVTVHLSQGRLRSRLPHSLLLSRLLTSDTSTSSLLISAHVKMFKRFGITKILLVLVISSEAINISLSFNIPDDDNNGKDSSFSDAPIKDDQERSSSKPKREAEKDAALASDFEGLNCDVNSLDGLLESLKGLMEDPQKAVSPPDYICTVLFLLKRSQENNADLTALQAEKVTTNSQLETLKTSLASQESKLSLLQEGYDALKEESESRFSSFQNQFNNYADEFLRSLEKQTDTIMMVSNNIMEIQQVREALNETMTLMEGISSSGANKSVSTLEGRFITAYEEVTKSLDELKSRTSKTEVEMVEKISEVVKELKTVETHFQSALKGEMDRALQRESELNSLLDEESTKVLESLEMFSAQLTSDMKSVRSEQIETFFQNITETLENRISAIFEQVTAFKLNMEQQLEDNILGKNVSEITEGIQELFHSQFKVLEALESQVTGKLDAEVSRAVKAEAELLHVIHQESAKSLQEIENSKSKVESELGRTESSLTNLHQTVQSQEEKLKSLEDEIAVQIKMESMRAKSSEAQLTSIITGEVERAKKAEGKLAAKIESTAVEVLAEIERSKAAEDSLTAKLAQEIERASSAETNLLSNINEELKRASEKEELLQELSQTNSQDLKELDERLDSRLRVLLNESSSAVESKVIRHLMKIEEIEGKFQSSLDEEISRAQEAEKSLQNTLETNGKKSQEFESTVLNTLMTGFGKAAEFEKEVRANLTAEIERAQRTEMELFQYQTGNWSDFDSKFENAFSLINNDTMTQVHNRIKDATDFLEEKIDSLSTSLETQITNATEEGEKKLKKVEEDLKKCCSNSGWFRRPAFLGSSSSSSSSSSSGGSSPGAATGVLDRVMGLFGRRRITAASSNKTDVASSKAAIQELKGRFLNLLNSTSSDRLPTTPTEELKSKEEGISTNPSNSAEESASSQARLLNLDPLEDPEESLQSGGESSLPVKIQRFNSKVNLIYG